MARRTTILDVHEDNPEPRLIRRAADSLANGDLILIPTDTGYSFVGDPNLESTLKRFLAFRPRHPVKQPFSLLCQDLAQCSNVALLDTRVYRIATRAFPGPFTFVLETRRTTPKYVAQGKPRTVGIRIPDHNVARSLLACFGGPLLVTSVTADSELDDGRYFDGHDEDAWWTEVDNICDHYGTVCDLALRNDKPVPMHVSTVIDFTTDPATIVRDGGWDLEPLGIVK